MEHKKNLDHLSRLFGAPDPGAPASLQHLPGELQHMIAEYAAHDDPRTAAQLSGVTHATNVRYGEARGMGRAHHDAQKAEKKANKNMQRTRRIPNQHLKYNVRRNAAQEKQRSVKEDVNDLFATPFHGLYDDDDDSGGGLAT